MQTNRQCMQYKCQGFDCTIRKSRRAKRVRLTVYCDGRVIATLPNRFSIRMGQDFVSEKSSWIARKLQEFKTKNLSILYHRNNQEYNQLKEQVRQMVSEKLQYFNHYYGHGFNRVAIKNQRTRWGSCSSDRNLNFNYKIHFLPEQYQNYLIVHELCHLREMNHSSRFWALVEKTIPNAKQLAREIRKM